MARKKIIENKQISEMAELIYKNLYKKGKAIVAESPYLYKVVDADELNKDNNYIFFEPLGDFYGKYKYISRKPDGTHKSEEETAEDLKKAFNTKDKHEFINTILKPEVRTGWQKLGYELKKYDFNQEVPYCEDEFIFVNTSPKNPIIPPQQYPIGNTYNVYSVYFKGQLILDGLNTEVCGPTIIQPFCVGDKKNIIINFDGYKILFLRIKNKTLYCRYVWGDFNLADDVKDYFYSTSDEKWLQMEIDDKVWFGLEEWMEV